MSDVNTFNTLQRGTKSAYNISQVACKTIVNSNECEIDKLDSKKST